MLRIRTIFLFFFIIGLSGCELYEQDEYKEYYVVESYLVANHDLPQVRLSKTTSVKEEYNYKEASVENAVVEIRRLDADSTIEEQYFYEDGGNGIYLPLEDIGTQVQEKRLYELYITTQDGQVITSITYVPGNFDTVNKDELLNKYIYQGEQQIEITTTPSEYITDRQTYYIFTVNVSDPAVNNLTPFYADLILEQENDIQNYYVNSSGIINERNYDRNEDGTITLKVPWLAIAFFGGNEVIANAIDDNLYNFLRSQSVQTGGTTLSPGEIQNIHYNVNGGIGVFGSMSSDTNRVFITRSAAE